MQGRLVLALILVQLKKGDSVAASKVGLLRHPGERSPWFRVFSFSQFFRFGSSGVVAVMVHRLKLQTA